jgi:hypothetical protein
MGRGEPSRNRSDGLDVLWRDEGWFVLPVKLVEYRIINGYPNRLSIKRVPHNMTTSMTRQDKILFRIKLDGMGLEIGRGYNPIAPKKEGFQVHTRDHGCKQDLIEKYTEMMNTQNISIDAQNRARPPEHDPTVLEEGP